MSGINSAIIVGNLTRDAELKYFSGGSAMVKFSIAVNRRKKVGEAWVDEAMFFDACYNGKSAESLHKYLIKGKKIGIQGELRQDRWEKDGQKQSKVYISCFEIQLLSGREDSREPGHDTPRETIPGKFASDGRGHDEGGFVDDIPFD